MRLALFTNKEKVPMPFSGQRKKNQNSKQSLLS
jgi:hypothetical protein